MVYQGKNQLGIVSYGAVLPRWCISAKTIARAHGLVDEKIAESLGITKKTVPSSDQDTATFATDAAMQAVERYELLTHTDPRSDIGALFIGSESHPYAVKPTGTVVAESLGISSNCIEGGKQLALADLQFACKAGTQSMQLCSLYVASGFCSLSLAIGADTAQSRPSDVLEYTAAAGGAAFLFGDSSVLVKLLATTSIATDTPDFWRRSGQKYPQHAGRFSGEPGYFYHSRMAVDKILNETALAKSDFKYCVFHTPNAKYPISLAQRLGFTKDQLSRSLIVREIGNTYAAASLLAFANVLDVAKAGEKILLVSYGSGAGSDAFVFQVTKKLEDARKVWKQNGNIAAQFVKNQIAILKEISYEKYRKNTSEL